MIVSMALAVLRKYGAQIAIVAALLALIAWNNMDQRRRGAEAVHRDQAERSAETATDVRKLQDENARDAVRNDARDRLRDGAARFTAD